MRFFRLLTVIVIVTILGGGFGAAVGGLVGFAVPSSINAMFGVQSAQTVQDPAATRAGQGKTVSLAIQKERGMAAEGAALGCAWGLIFGVAIGVLLGALDQIILIIRAWLASRPSAGINIGSSASK